MFSGCNEQWADVHPGSETIGRDVLSIAGDSEMDALGEELNGWLGKADERGGVAHTVGVLVRSEDADLTILLTESWNSGVWSGAAFIQTLNLAGKNLYP